MIRYYRSFYFVHFHYYFTLCSMAMYVIRYFYTHYTHILPQFIRQRIYRKSLREKRIAALFSSLLISFHFIFFWHFNVKYLCCCLRRVTKLKPFKLIIDALYKNRGHRHRPPFAFLKIFINTPRKISCTTYDSNTHIDIRLAPHVHKFCAK